jgi:TM2 domain-containing membrane protein YozV
MCNRPKNRTIEIILGILGIISPIPIAGLHKFYLGQPAWGLVYLLLWSTPIPRIATTIDLVWYVIQSNEQFDLCFNSSENSVALLLSNVYQHKDIPQTLRELDQLREDGLISEGEFEYKRRELLDQI